MFVLGSDITIGKFRFEGVHEVRVKKSLLNYMDTAVIKLPARCRVGKKSTTESSADFTITAQQFKRGDKVSVKLGYNGELKTEFEGFVSRVNGGRPCEIECEGYSFLLREKTLNKSYRKTTLLAVLKDIVAGTDIILSKDIPDVQLDKINMAVVNGQASDGVPVLDNLKQALGKVLFVNFENNVLFAGLGYTRVTNQLKQRNPDAVYVMGRNCITDDLKERVKGDKAVVAFFSARKNDGQYLSAKAGEGEDGVQRMRVPHVQSEVSLKELATAKESIINYSGLEGTITGFLQPYCKPGQKIKFSDPQNAARNCNLIVDATEVHFNSSGARRIVTASHAL